uniref:Serpentine receptor class gamma n=1 Tax=Panagrellus redivivus TaxID=6233 RepID=A0A7E4V800_PANRE
MHIDDLEKVTPSGSKISVPADSLIEGWTSYLTNFNAFYLFNFIDKIPVIFLIASWASYLFDNYTLHQSMSLRSWFVNSNAIFDARNHVPCKHATPDGTIFPSLLRMCYFHGLPTILIRASALSLCFGRIFLIACVTAKWKYQKSKDDHAYSILHPLLMLLNVIEMASLAIFLTTTSHLDSPALNKVSAIIFVLAAQLTMLINSVVVTRLEAISGKYIVSNLLQGFFIVFGVAAPLTLLIYFDFVQGRPCLVTVPIYKFALEMATHIGYVGYYQALKYVLKDVQLPIFGNVDDVIPKPAEPHYRPRILFGKEEKSVVDRALTRS